MLGTLAPCWELEVQSVGSLCPQESQFFLLELIAFTKVTKRSSQRAITFLSEYEDLFFHFPKHSSVYIKPSPTLNSTALPGD
jgi:hypothetical protein